jgi:hypothetical protein
MGALTDLGLDTTDGAVMCVAAPDSVLAEAGAMKPRPSFASTLLTAEPTARLAWWPERRYLEPQTLSRLKWLIETARGQAWLILDEAEEESPSEAELRAALAKARLSAGPGRAIGGGELAVSVDAR